MNKPELSPRNRELLSALADGELLQEEFSALFDACEKDSVGSGSWNTYHVIGEALRSPGSAVQLTDLAFLARLNQQLIKEPSFGSWPQTDAVMRVNALVPDSEVVGIPVSTILVGEHRGPASNDGQFRWKMLAGFACAVAVGTVTWSGSGSSLPASGPQLAQSGISAGGAVPAQVVVASPQGLMVRDARLEELLAAHKQLGATSALPVPSGFLRNATFETQQSLGR